MLRILLFATIILFELSTFAKEHCPWFTGSLIANAGLTIPAKHVNLEPYLFLASAKVPGSSSRLYSVQPALNFSFGITEYMDFQTFLPYAYEKVGSKSDAGFVDFPVLLGFQALSANFDTAKPDLRVTITEILPVGKYDNLDPNKRGTDLKGRGSFVTLVALNFEKLYQPYLDHFFRLRVNLQYGVAANTSIKGISAYGGSFGTKGKVNPGNPFITTIGMEYSLTQNWALAFDIDNIYRSKSTFSGKRGFLPNGKKAKVGEPIFDQCVLAPAIEYNFSANAGFIIGPVFSVYSKNANDFYSLVMAYNYFY